MANSNGWWGLHSVFRESREEFDAYVSRPPMACPNDGEPLRNGPSNDSGTAVELFCKFCGYSFPRDFDPPVRMDSGSRVSPL